MRILFVNHAFPGIFGALAAFFAASGHDVLFASGFRRRDFSLPGVRHITLAPPKESRAAGASRHAPGLEAALSAGAQALHAFLRLADMDLAPDMVLVSADDGYGLFCDEAFPHAFRVGWAGTSVFPGAGTRGETGFTRHLLQCRYAVSCHTFVCTGTGEESPFSSRLAHGLDAPCTVNTEWFSPGGSGGPELVLFYTGRQEPEACAPVVTEFLKRRGRCHAAVLCEGRTAWERWKAVWETMPHRERLHLPGTLSLEQYRDLLRAASLLVCLPGNTLPAATLLEAMSSGVAPVLEQGTGPAFLRAGKNAFFFPGKGTEAVFSASVLEARAPLSAVRSGARAAILARFDQQKVIPQHARLLLEAYGAWKEERDKAEI